MIEKCTLICLLCFCSSFHLQEKPISVIDFVKIKNGHQAEAIYFYENNWTVYRKMALKKNQIRSYEIWRTRSDSSLDADLILMTVYRDSAQWRSSEINFAAIIKEVRPNGPQLLNDRKPSEFRQLIATKMGETLITN